MKHIFLTLTFLLSVNAQAKIFEERLISKEKAKKILNHESNLDDEDSIFYEDRTTSRKKFIPEDRINYEVFSDADTIISKIHPVAKKGFVAEEGIPQGDSIPKEDIISAEDSIPQGESISVEDVLPSEEEIVSKDDDIGVPVDVTESKISFGLDSPSKGQILTTVAATSVILDKVTEKNLRSKNEARILIDRKKFSSAEAKLLKQNLSGKFVPQVVRAVSRLSGLATAAITGYSIGQFIVEVDKNKFDGKLVNAVSTSKYSEFLFKRIYKLEQAISGVR